MIFAQQLRGTRRSASSWCVGRRGFGVWYFTSRVQSDLALRQHVSRAPSGRARVSRRPGAYTISRFRSRSGQKLEKPAGFPREGRRRHLRRIDSARVSRTGRFRFSRAKYRRRSTRKTYKCRPRGRTTTGVFSMQQVPANHQRRRHHDQGQDACGTERHDRGRMRGDDLRAAGVEGQPRQTGRNRAQAAVDEMRTRNMRNHTRTLVAAACLTVITGVAAYAQAPAAPPQTPPAQAQPPAQSPTQPVEQPAAAAALPAAGYTYDPAGRRDPFLSLMGRGTDPASMAVRPQGLPGLLIGEITVKGIVRDRAGFIAMLQGRTARTFLSAPASV